MSSPRKPVTCLTSTVTAQSSQMTGSVTPMTGSVIDNFQAQVRQLGALIRAQRKALRLSRDEVADRAGISAGLLSAMEAGSCPTQTNFPFVQEVLKKEAARMMTVSGEIVTGSFKARHIA